MKHSSQKNRHDPYAVIRNFWGEDLSPTLLDRILNAPDRHLTEFDSYLVGNRGWGGFHLPTLPAGHLRPVVSVNAVDYVASRGERDFATLAAAETALIVLLYAHQVILDDVSDMLVDADHAVRKRAGEWLLSIRPLFHKGYIHFAPVTSIKRHPSNAAIVGGLLRNAERLAHERNSEIEAFVLAGIIGDGPISEDELQGFRVDAIGALLLDATSYNRYSLTWPDQVHRLLRSRAEEAALKLVLGQLSPSQQQSVDLRKLIELSVPRFLADTKSLVAMRENEEHFADWRQQLGLALDRVTVADPTDQSEIQRARQLLQGELEPLRNRMEKAVRKSSAMEAFQSGTAGFGVSAVAASAAWLAGGSLPAALTSAAVTKGVDSFLSYLRQRQALRGNSAVLDLTLMFENR